jgi:hypothetical protein
MAKTKDRGIAKTTHATDPQTLSPWIDRRTQTCKTGSTC